MANANITRCLAALAQHEGSAEIALRVTHSENNGFQVAIRATLPGMAPMPLFDDNGDACLSAYGATLDEAMAKLDAICATCHPEHF